MADLGRFGVSTSLKRLLDLSGEYLPSLDEAILPVIQLTDIEFTPFSLSVPWVWRTARGATALEYAYIVIQPGASLPENAWVSVDEIFVGENAADTIFVSPVILTDLPTLTTPTTDLSVVSCRQPAFPTASKWLVGEVNFRSGSSTTQLTSNSLGLRTEFKGAIAGRWAFTRGGALAIGSATLGAGLGISASGRVHLTTAR